MANIRILETLWKIRDENLKEKKVDSAGPESATLGLYPIALPIELRAQIEKSLVFSVIPTPSIWLTRGGYSLDDWFKLSLEGEGSGSYGMPAAQSHQLGS